MRSKQRAALPLRRRGGWLAPPAAAASPAPHRRAVRWRGRRSVPPHPPHVSFPASCRASGRAPRRAARRHPPPPTGARPLWRGPRPGGCGPPPPTHRPSPVPAWPADDRLPPPSSPPLPLPSPPTFRASVEEGGGPPPVIGGDGGRVATPPVGAPCRRAWGRGGTRRGHCSRLTTVRGGAAAERPHP